MTQRRSLITGLFVPALVIVAVGAGLAWWVAGQGFDAAEVIEQDRDGVVDADVVDRGDDPLENVRTPAPPFTVHFAGELEGRAWIPTCSVEREGGLLRLTGAVEEFAAGVPDGMLVATGNHAGAPGEAGALEYETALRIMTETGLGVTAIGEKDLMIGLDRWRAIKNEALAATGIVCANLRDAEDRALVPGHAYLPIRREGVHRVLVTAVLSPTFLRPLHAAGVDVKLLDPAESVRATLAEAGEHDYAVLISHAPVEESRRLFEQLEDIDLVVSGKSPDGLPSLDPEVKDGRLFVVAASGWRALGRVVLASAPDGGIRMLEYSTRPVSNQIAPSPMIGDLLTHLKSQFDADGFFEDALAAAAARATGAEGRYAGPESCATCHPEAHASWAMDIDPHHESMRRIRELEFERVFQCLPCHTTAPGRPGGHLVPGDAQSRVSCEACHGPGADHVDANGTVELRDPWASCADCHTLEMNPAFDPAKAWEKARHE